MITPPSLPPSPQLFQDAEHLRYLSLAHYVMAGITGFFACIPIIHVSMGAMMVSGKFPMAAGSGHPGMPPELQMAGWFFIAIGGLMILLGWALAVVMFLTARWLAARKNKTFCFVVACVECIHMPLGTILGVFTIITLQRPSVGMLFETPEKPAL